MKKENQKEKNVSDLRKKAEKKLNPETIDLKKLSDEDVHKLVHELQVHQIELDMQNEELRRVQTELEKTRDKYSHLYHLAPVGYFTISDKGIILEANLTGAKMLGEERNFLIGKPLGLFITKEYQDVFYLQRKDVCQVKGKSGSRELVMKKKDGTHFYAQLECKATRDTGQKDTECLTIMSDITERKKAELELEEYRNHLEALVEERTKELKYSQNQLVRKEKLATVGQVSASIAHELRNPLATIKNSSYYLSMVLKEADEKVKKHLTIIDKSVDHSGDIITNLLDLTKVRSLTLMQQDVGRIIKDVLANYKGREGIIIKTQLDDELPVTELDPSLILSVFDNIISNSVQAMPEGGRLDIKTGVKDGFINVEFKDTGVGISKENVQTIFEPLFTTKANGIGLGLTIVKNIIDEHNGKIMVESEIGKGTTFTVKFPITK